MAGDVKTNSSSEPSSDTKNISEGLEDKEFYDRIDLRFDQLSNRAQKRQRYDQYILLLLFGLIIFIMPIAPAIIADTIIDTFNISNVDRGSLIGVLWTISSAIYVVIAIKFWKKNKEVSYLTSNENTFLYLQIVKIRIDNAFRKDEIAKEETIDLLKRQLINIKYDLDEYGQLEGLFNESNLNMMKKLIESFDEKIIPLLLKKKDIKKILKIIDLVSCIYLEEKIDPYRNEAQVILDNLVAEKVDKAPSFRDKIKARIIYSKKTKKVIDFLILLLVTYIIADSVILSILKEMDVDIGGTEIFGLISVPIMLAGIINQLISKT